MKEKRDIPGVKYIVAVASGKGGVGKSTTTLNLAYALQAQGLAVGILDGDIYGPSLPRLLKSPQEKPLSEDGKTMQPLEINGLKVMSIGFLVDEETPAIWRGPMVHSALTQLLFKVQWGPLDILLIDMPPGTGDAHLTLTQSVFLRGAIIVTTPQDLALIDATKGLRMFEKVNVPLLGIIENMSTFVCPHCSKETAIFSTGGGKREAERLHVPFLGSIPLTLNIREQADKGGNVKERGEGKYYEEIARKVLESL